MVTIPDAATDSHQTIVDYLSPAHLGRLTVEQLHVLCTFDFEPDFEDDIIRWNLVSAELRRRGIDAPDFKPLEEEPDQDETDEPDEFSRLWCESAWNIDPRGG